jgi:hypothetical protein
VTFDPRQAICLGTIDLPDGTTRALAADLAGEGADLYHITAAEGKYHGHSTQGHRLEATRMGMFVMGMIAEKNGARLPFMIMDLSQAYRYAIPSGRRDQYTVIVSRNGTLHYGRGGAVKGGKPNPNLIALDVQASDIPTPGFYFGKVAFERDVIGIKVDPPDADGNRRVRAYMSDSEPQGDLQWFGGKVAGETVELVSASGDATLRATLEDDLILGELVLSGDRVRRFFALPAGDGAGIYDVTVHADGTMEGMSEEGGRLDAVQDGVFVELTLTTSDGRVFVSHPNDLTRALDYPVPGNQPDTYVAIVAPRGRFVFGRSGNVRGGSPGLFIIGLDKSC